MRSLKEIQALVDGVTPGYWRHRQGVPTDPAGFVEAPDPGKPYGIEVLGDESYPTKEADAAFIAAAPEIVRDLLAAVDELEYEWIRNATPPVKCAPWPESRCNTLDKVASGE